MHQQWHDLLFAHWPLRPDAVKPLLPEGLELDTFGGEAWIGIVPFRMTGVRPDLLPALPWLSAFPELNVRTYVRGGGHTGVWFISLDAPNPVAVALARRGWHLPYFRAAMACKRRGDTILYKSRRSHPGAPRAVFAGSYRPSGPPVAAQEGSLEHFLTERYSFFARDPTGGLWRGPVEHPPWPLQPAELELRANRMTRLPGLRLPEKAPLCHFSQRQVARFRPREQVRLP